MKKRFFPGLGLFMFTVMTVMALAPLNVSAAGVSSASKPHFFLNQSLVHSNATIPFATQNLTYHGGPVMAGTAHAYAIFWEPGGNVASNYNSLIERYFGDIGGSSLYHINTQYTNSSHGFASNAVFAGAWVDTHAYPESPLLDSDLQHEVSRALKSRGWKSGLHNVFFVYTQRNEDICFDSSLSECASNAFCAYHSNFGNTLYAAMPYAASFSCDPGSSPNHSDADQTINVTSHEQMEAATDPLGNAWTDSSGNEIGDKCAWRFGPLNSSGGDVVWNGHNYIVQTEWDNKIKGCALTGP